MNTIILWVAYIMWTLIAHFATCIMTLAIVAFGETGGRETYRRLAYICFYASFGFALLATFTKP